MVSWPDSSLKCQTFNKRTAVLYRKVFFSKVAIFPTEMGFFFFYIKTCQTLVLRGKTMSKTEGNACHDFPGQNMQHRQTLAKSQSVKGGESKRTLEDTVFLLNTGETNVNGAELGTITTFTIFA